MNPNIADILLLSLAIGLFALAAYIVYLMREGKRMVDRMEGLEKTTEQKKQEARNRKG